MLASRGGEYLQCLSTVAKDRKPGLRRICPEITSVSRRRVNFQSDRKKTDWMSILRFEKHYLISRQLLNMLGNLYVGAYLPNHVIAGGRYILVSTKAKNSAETGYWMKFTSTQKNLKNQFVLVVVISLSLLTTGGCSGPSNPDGRENVSGTISLNGAPLTGMSGIVFSPTVKGSDGGGQGQISTGKYALTGADGVKPGNYTVRITSSIDFDIKTGKPADNTIQFGSEVPVDVLPPKFNKQSTIEFEVVARKNNVFNYNIKTDYVPEMPKNAKTKEAIPL